MSTGGGGGDWVGQVAAWLGQQQQQQAAQQQQARQQLHDSGALAGARGAGRGAVGDRSAGAFGGGFSGNPLNSARGTELSGHDAASVLANLSGLFGMPTFPGESGLLGSMLNPYDVYHRGPVTGTSGPTMVPNVTVRDAGAIHGAADGQYGYSAMNAFGNDEANFWGQMNPGLGLDFGGGRGTFGNSGGVGSGTEADPYRGSASPWGWGYAI